MKEHRVAIFEPRGGSVVEIHLELCTAAIASPIDSRSTMIRLWHVAHRLPCLVLQEQERLVSEVRLLPVLEAQEQELLREFLLVSDHLSRLLRVSVKAFRLKTQSLQLRRLRCSEMDQQQQRLLLVHLFQVAVHLRMLQAPASLSVLLFLVLLLQAFRTRAFGLDLGSPIRSNGTWLHVDSTRQDLSLDRRIRSNM